MEISKRMFRLLDDMEPFIPVPIIGEKCALEHYNMQDHMTPILATIGARTLAYTPLVVVIYYMI